MSKWWICIVSRPQTTLISRWGLHTFIPLQWRHNQRNGVSNHQRVSIVYPTVCSGADPRQHQSSASLAFVRGINRWPLNSAHKGPVTRKMFPFDDVIMYRYTLGMLICSGGHHGEYIPSIIKAGLRNRGNTEYSSGFYWIFSIAYIHAILT